MLPPHTLKQFYQFFMEPHRVHLVASFQEGFLVSLEEGTVSSLTESLLQNQLQNPVFLQNQLH
jgi:hypothetical protein